MPGRQSHGRPLLGQAKGKGRKQPQKGKAGSRAAALDAFALAAKDVPTNPGIRGTRARDLDFEPNQRKRPRGGGDREDEDHDDDDDDDDGEEDAHPRNKRARNAGDGDGDDEFGSDSDGDEWRIGVGEDDDSELDSDEAFGESDEDRFDGFTFRGSSSNKKQVKKKSRKAEDSDDGEGEGGEEDDDDERSSLGEDAIDLAQALDQVSDDDENDEGSAGDTESGSEDEDEDSSPESSLSDDDLDMDDGDPSKLDALQNLAAGFAGNGDDQDTPTANTKTKVALKDLALFGVKDANIKKSLKLMNKEEKAAAKPGTSQKLDVPLARRQQDKLLRIAAAEKANKTLDRWQDTVKHNRRAEHLVFPLPDTLHDAGLDKGELAPLDRKSAGNELEQTIMSIMEESGLGPSSKPKEAEADEGGAGAPGMSREEMQEIWAQRRREREEKSREQARAARIKKIKSKAYRRVHRRERQKLEAAMDEEGGAVDSEEEREAQHRKRALERVGAKHRDSKWAKSAKRAGLAAWDEGVRTGMTEMARRDEELRRRVEGKAVGGRAGGDDDEDEDSGFEAASGSEDERSERQRLLRELEQAEAEQDGPHSNLMKMKFMQRAEAVRKQANDALVAQIRRELNSDEEDGDDDEEEEAGEVGRRTYGVPDAKKPKTKPGAPEAGTLQALTSALKKTDSSRSATATSSSVSQAVEAVPGIAGSWSRPGAARRAEGASRKGKKGPGTSNDDATIDLSNSIVSGAAKAAEKAARKPPAPGSQASGGGGGVESGSEDDDAALHLPLQIRDRELVDRAFAGDDVVGAFEREKAAVESEDDDKIVDNTLPGWGSWGGEGVSNRQKKKSNAKFLTKIEGVKKQDRKDAKLERVIISEKRVRKNDKYLASQLPHVFENKDQYERSLRLPVGPEWTTKQTFQDATKPRILMKQGIIAPMAKPMAR
ncbi:small nucleolar ribonucleoprotein complex subunit Utp14 [Magnaporthiopsis poae ATCC 64411]|uniref:Small nucleolar ribonucleoprotein complex subunit Utp14 n=1 Tax=Magnaporthiopsis poae (strain ATCC 64411 / 73-15) TaxID=644358 RepID=A0A0C4EEC2_MAGP6|nr:small nucleolar ribonucleoprotein complex subunit Utp14 [Magnaporthiopsis poae ATCC 64411]